MSKIVIRKSIFETASSSEDSVSIYQDMHLYILPLDIYNKFISGEVYVKFNNINPSWIDDEDYVIAANENSIKEAKIRLEAYDDLIYIPYYHSDGLYYLENYYTNYNVFQKVVSRYYYDFEFFTYENGNDVIFGFYGYTED